MTKAEERSILEQMRKLSEGTFYIAETFDGVWEIAERNIDDDSVCNPVKDRQAEFERKLREDAERGARIVTIEHERDTAQNYAESLESRIFDLEKLLDAERKIAEDLREENAKLNNGIDDMQEKLKDRDAKIVNLKAEVYDWMTEAMK